MDIADNKHVPSFDELCLQCSKIHFIEAPSDRRIKRNYALGQCCNHSKEREFDVFVGHRALALHYDAENVHDVFRLLRGDEVCIDDL